MRRILLSLNLIWVLTWMNFMPRSRRETAKLFWVFMEPAGQLAMLMLLFTFIGRISAYGVSFALFLMTGIVMLSYFNTGSSLIMNGMEQMGGKARLADLGVFHQAIARLFFKVITAVGYTSILAFGLGIFEGVRTFPYHMVQVIEVFFWGGLLAFGMGLCRAYALRHMPALQRIYTIVTRGLIFISGVFFVPSFMPPQIRDLLAYNPILHMVELFRLGMYDQYPSIVYSATYLQLWALGSTALGMALIWNARREFMH